MKAKIKTDVAVIGGGPAGSAVAARLADEGLKVALIDRQTFPRDKVCGDYVSQLALAELDEMGVKDFKDINLIRRGAIFVDGDQIAEHRLPASPGVADYGAVIPRKKLDEQIWQKAIRNGARDLSNHAFQRYEINGNRVDVHLKGSVQRIRARVVVGADGSASRVARQLDRTSLKRFHRVVAIRAYYENVAGPMDRCDVHYSHTAFPGYCWLFPSGHGCANVGLGMLSETTPSHEEKLSGLLEQAVEQDSGLRERLANSTLVAKFTGAPLATFDPKRPLVGERVLLVGDAAGLINPLNGEGIQYALESARWAAETLRDCSESGEFHAAALAGYEKRVQQEMGFDMAVASLFIDAIRNRTLGPIWLEMMSQFGSRASSDPQYADIAAGILSGLIPARHALDGRMFVGSFRQFLDQWRSLADQHPEYYAREFSKWLKVGSRATAAFISDPVDHANWIVSMARSTTRLSMHVIQQLVNPNGQSRKQSVSADPRSRKR